MNALIRTAAANKAAAISSVVLAGLVLAAAFAPYIAPYDPNVQNLSAARIPPCPAHLLGTDFQGGDVLSKIIFGCRQAAAIAFGVSLSTVAAGFFAGLLSGYAGGRLGTAIMRLVDVTMAFPALLLNIILVAVLGAGFGSLFLALTLTGWAPVARITRALVLSLSNAEYVTGARALGASGPRIIMRHVVPNCFSTVIVVFAMRAGGTLLAAAGLNYLGLGDPQDTNAWGTMVNLGQFDIVTAWWWPIFPATAIALTVTAMNVIADALRDRFDPRMRGRLE